MTLREGSGVLQHGDVVIIKTFESEVGNKNRLTANSSYSTLFYNQENDGHQHFIVRKCNFKEGDDPIIHEQDALHFVSKHYSGQYLCPYESSAYDDLYLSTDSSVPACWFIKNK